MTTTTLTPIQAFAGDEYDDAREARYSAEHAKRRAEEQSAAWLAEHPEVSEAAPSWTDELEIDFDDENTVYATSGRDVGLYQLRQCNIWCGGEVTTGDAFTLWHPAGDYFHASNARELAAYARARALELLTIAATLEAEEVTA
jgi:hypothetical protein